MPTKCNGAEAVPEQELSGAGCNNKTVLILKNKSQFADHAGRGVRSDRQTGAGVRYHPVIDSCLINATPA